MGSHKLVEIAFYVSLIVVIALAITFSILFALYAIYKRKHIKYGHEDEKILNDLKKKYRRDLEKSDAFSVSTDSKNDENTVKEAVNTEEENKNDNEQVDGKLVTCMKKREKKSKVGWIISKVCLGVVCVALFVVGGFIISYKMNNDHFFFGDTTYMVIQTGSMETQYEGNKYLKENNLNNQITQYSMIGVKKISAKDVELYDILAFKNTEGETIVHRVINIENKDNKYFFTFRGDANSGTSLYETSVKEENIIGKYTGFQNYGLGVTVTYFKSSAGIVALVAAFVFLFTFEVADDLVEEEYKKRCYFVAKQYDVSGE